MLRPSLMARLLLCGFVLCLLGGGLALAQAEPSTGQIVYGSDKDGDFELYLLDLATGAETQLTDNDTFDGLPAWSPDGAQIVFVSERDGNYEIYRMDADGGNLTRLTDTPARETYPSFSPDGSLILFDTDRNGQGEIYIMDPDGSNPHNLTEHDANDSRPVWSPDGTQVLFLSVREGETRDLWVLTLEDGALQRLTEDEARDVPLAWLAASNTILYRSNAHGDGSDQDIYAFALETGMTTNLTQSPHGENSASESPDGVWIAYRATVDGNADIYIMDPEGGSIQRVTEDAASDVDPAWRPLVIEEAPESGAETVTCTISAPGGVNLRGGPGTTYDVVGGLAAGETAPVDGQAVDGAGYTWYQLADGAGWAREDVVSVPAGCAAVAVVTP